MSTRTSMEMELKERRARAFIHLPAEDYVALGFTANDVVALERSIRGEVVLSGDHAYDAARRQDNPAFNRFPRLIVYCETPGDVRQALAFARRTGINVTCRSGGHSTAGYSVSNGGMVLDTSRMRDVHLTEPGSAFSREQPAGPTYASMGPGTPWGYVGAFLDGYGLHVPGGGCDSVRVAGFMQGGGYGYTSRMYGMNCDSVVEAKVMLADGRIAIANDRRNFPLFWAIRGGTGNNFGVLLEATYRLHRPGPFWGFSVPWGIDHAAPAIVAIQDGYMKTNDSRRIGFETHCTTIDGRRRGFACPADESAWRRGGRSVAGHTADRHLRTRATDLHGRPRLARAGGVLLRKLPRRLPVPQADLA